MSLRFKRWWWVLLLVAIGIGQWRLRFDADILDLLPPDEPTVEGLKLYQEHFTNARELIVTLRAPDAEQASRVAAGLAARLQRETNLITSVSWQPPWTEDPGQLAELLGCLWLNQPPESFGALTNRLAPERLKAVLDDTKATLTLSLSPMDVARRAFDPYDLLNLPALAKLGGVSFASGDKGFASADGTFRVLFVEANQDLAGYRACADWLKSVEGIVAGARAQQPAFDWAGVRVGYTGRPVFVREIAASMQHDLSGSVVGTAVIIAALFWLTHRRWLPMLWLLTLLGLLLAATLALGGLILGTISVVSMGFAAVLLGLAVDYAVVHYQEAVAHTHLTVPEIRRAIAPSILWAAITTMSAFLVLNLGGLPGLAQLGTLVAIGVGLSALVMVMIYLPPLFPGRRKAPPGLKKVSWWTYFVPRQESVTGGGLVSDDTPKGQGRAALVVTGLILFTAGAIVFLHPPELDKTGDALRPERGPAQTAVEEMTVEMGLPADPFWVVVSGRTEPEVYERLAAAEGLLDPAVKNRVIGGYLLPTALWPRAEYQATNRGIALALAAEGPLLRETAIREGFNTNALVLTEELLRLWRRAGTSSELVWPTNRVSQWLLAKCVARTADQWLVMGAVYPATNQVPSGSLAELSAHLSEHHVLLSGWGLLGSATLKRVRARMWEILTPMVILVLTSLWLAFRRATEILLGLAVLLLSGLCLLATMAMAGWSWNLLNLMALPLMLGTGVDYSIFMQLALRRHGGNLALVRRSIGRALLLCGGTAMTGFGSLAWSSNPGMASLGRVCAVGIGANMLISVFLLPFWWKKLGPKAEGRRPNDIRNPKSEGIGSSSDGLAVSKHSEDGTRIALPSAFYRAGLWRVGLAIVRVLPGWLVKAACIVTAELYFLLQRGRREVVIQNLLPVLGGERRTAEQAAHRLYRKFAVKLVDLWRIESGLPVHDWLTRADELDLIRAARQRGRGVLFITLHLGNWEHGGLLMSQLDVPLTMLSLAEVDGGLTELRIATRARCGVRTLIIGQNDFAFVEAIKLLQTGAFLAISIDRPPDRGAVTIEWFGRRFEASNAAAELARASGCALIGVMIVRRRGGYAVKVLPEFSYERGELGNRDARRALTQEILRAFEPHIRQDIDQWYQFVPIWPNHA